MNPRSASTLVWGAAAACLFGLFVMSPSGQFALYVLAILLAIVPTAFGGKRSRIAGGLIVLISLAFAWQCYPAFRKEGDDYRRRAAAKTQKAPSQLPVQQQEKR